MVYFSTICCSQSSERVVRPTIRSLRCSCSVSAVLLLDKLAFSEKDTRDDEASLSSCMIAVTEPGGGLTFVYKSDFEAFWAK